MKKSLTIASLAALLTIGGATTSAFASDPDTAAATSDAGATRARRHRHGHMRPRLSRMAERLELSDAQKSQIREIVRTTRVRARAQRVERAALTPEQRRAFRSSMRTDTRTAILAVLTDAQKAELRTLRANRPARAERAEPGNRANRGERGNRGRRTRGNR